MLMNTPASMLILICNKSTYLRNILVYCEHIGMRYIYIGSYMTVYVHQYVDLSHANKVFTNMLMKYADNSASMCLRQLVVGWYIPHQCCDVKR